METEQEFKRAGRERNLNAKKNKNKAKNKVI